MSRKKPHLVGRSYSRTQLSGLSTALGEVLGAPAGQAPGAHWWESSQKGSGPPFNCRGGPGQVNNLSRLFSGRFIFVVLFYKHTSYILYWICKAYCSNEFQKVTCHWKIRLHSKCGYRDLLACFKLFICRISQ